MTPEGWTEGARVKKCVLGRVGGARVGREEGPGLLTWSFVNGSLLACCFLPQSPSLTRPPLPSRPQILPQRPCAWTLWFPKGPRYTSWTSQAAECQRLGARWPVPEKWPRFTAPRKGRFSQGRFGDAPEGFLLPVSLPPRSDPAAGCL